MLAKTSPFFKVVRFFYYFIKYIYLASRILILYIFRGISAFVPKRKNLWLFGSRRGQYFSDNAKYLFLYVHQESNDIDAVWISKNQEVVRELRKKKLPAYYAYSLNGILACLRAKIIFTTEGKNDVNASLTGSSIHVELLHFVLVIKKVRYDVFNYYSLLQKIRLVLENPFIYFKPDFSISSSSFTSQIVVSSLSLSNEQVFLTGLPRTDAMLSKTEEDRENIQKIIDGQVYSQLIYFVPTYRDGYSDFNFFAFGYDKNKLISFLEKTNSIFIVRFHPTDSLYRNPIPMAHSRIIFENHGLTDAFSMLKETSVLITDYSSIFVDYLLLDRPIIFANFDHEVYMSRREIYWNYDEITPGPKVQNWDLLLEHLEKIVVFKKDEYQEARKKLRDQIYQFKDSNSCARVVKEMSRVSSK